MSKTKAGIWLNLLDLSFITVQMFVWVFKRVSWGLFGFGDILGWKFPTQEGFFMVSDGNHKKFQCVS